MNALHLRRLTSLLIRNNQLPFAFAKNSLSIYEKETESFTLCKIAGSMHPLQGGKEETRKIDDDDGVNVDIDVDVDSVSEGIGGWTHPTILISVSIS